MANLDRGCPVLFPSSDVLTAVVYALGFRNTPTKEDLPQLVGKDALVDVSAYAEAVLLFLRRRSTREKDLPGGRVVILLDHEPTRIVVP